MPIDSKQTRTFTLGQGLAVFQEQGDQLHILNPLARWIWESSANGMNIDEIKTIISEQTAHDGQTVEELFTVWARANLKPLPPESTKRRTHYNHRYWIGGGRIQVESDDQNLLQKVHICLAHLEEQQTGPIAGTISLCHEENGYVLYKNKAKIHSFESENDLIVQAIWEVIEIGCQVPGCLITVHGAAVAKGGVCFILAGAGGSGKTTLTAGLVSSGYTLVADDVIPVVTRSGLLEPVPMSMCIKEGSWPVLQDLYAEAEGFPVYSRFGKTVRFYPPPLAAVPVPTVRYRAKVVIFPRYTPESKPQTTLIEPHDILAELIRSNSIIDKWSQEKLEQVSAWVSGLGGYRLTYPDLLSGMNLVGDIFRKFAK